MPVKVTLESDHYGDSLDPDTGTDQEFVLNDRKEYAKVGFAVARWARESLRNARLREGGDSASMTLHIDFFGELPAEPAKKPATKRRRKKGKSNGAAE